ncbi:YHS domain-containing (seleno)protein [Reyranella sp.]|uniref:YHS domain-containing (seleno)protein n=1 Tax=Reyranella sp. TaxID=1929291 RepID=UPI003D10EBB3
MSTRRAFLWGMAAATLAVGMAAAPLSFAQPRPAVAERLGLKGYDPVAYFTLGVATLGVADHELVWDGVRYRFANAWHRDLFRADPDKYAPQFGGQCAMNMANGNLRESDPTIWTISDGRLYVFASAAGSERFRQDSGTNATKASGNWQNLKRSPGP